MGRITEAGELTSALAMGDFISRDTKNIANWLSAVKSTLTDIAVTNYDVSYSLLPSEYFIPENLRNRVSWIARFNDAASSDYSSFTNVKDSVSNSEFSVRDTLNFPVRELLFYDHRLVNYLFPASNGHFLLDEMIVGKPEILDTIYRQLYDQLSR